MASSPDAPPPVTVTVLFADGSPDLALAVPAPHTTTVKTLRQLIRAQRPAVAPRKLRLIHAGRVLAEALPLAQLVRAPPPPDAKGKGRAADARLWIHCSVGEPLSATALATEASPLSPAAGAAYDAAPPPSTLPAPAGFDRLLTQGFSDTEVAALRGQFSRQNPDVAPGEMRALEDQWIDESVGQGGAGGAGGIAESGMYEDMLWGTVMGFFWPVSVWLAREEGVFTTRRRDAFFAGVLMNLAFGTARMFGS